MLGKVLKPGKNFLIAAADQRVTSEIGLHVYLKLTLPVSAVWSKEHKTIGSYTT